MLCKLFTLYLDLLIFFFISSVYGLQVPAHDQSIGIDPAMFWSFLKTQEWMDGRRYEHLPSLMELLMSFPHSSASAERQFSLLKLMKSPLRNRLKPTTINAMMHIHRYIPNVVDWVIPKTVLHRAFKSRWKNNSMQKGKSN